MLILSDADLIILCIISFNEPISGYQINKRVAADIFRFWVDLSQSSVYSRLKMLERKRLITAVPNPGKTGKGPQSVEFSMTELGQRTLEYRILECLETPDIKKGRFDLGVFAISLIKERHLIGQTLLKRIQALHTRAEEVNRIINGTNPAQPEQRASGNFGLLLNHTLSQIKAEIDYTRQLMEQLKENELA